RVFRLLGLSDAADLSLPASSHRYWYMALTAKGQYAQDIACCGVSRDVAVNGADGDDVNVWLCQQVQQCQRVIDPWVCVYDQPHSQQCDRNAVQTVTPRWLLREGRQQPRCLREMCRDTGAVAIQEVRQRTSGLSEQPTATAVAAWQVGQRAAP